VHAFCEVREEQVVRELTLSEWYVHQLMAVSQLLFSVVPHEELMLLLRLIFLLLLAIHAQDDRLSHLVGLNEQEFCVHGEQYGDPYGHHQRSLTVDQYQKFG
jgi:hypothetical protein